MMAVYRTISLSFWTDTNVVDNYTPEDKYFMLYCLTNTYTNLCGCYEISIKQMSRDLGYNEETIRNLLDRFKNIHKIIFYNEDNKELFIKNWSKYNWTKSEKLDKPLLEEIKKIKTSGFKGILVDLYNKRDSVSIPYIYPMDTSVTATATDAVPDNNKKEFVKNDEKLQQLFINCTGSTNLQAVSECISYLEELPYEVIESALLKTSEKNGGWKYAKAILQRWLSAGIKTIEQVKAEEINYQASKKPKNLIDEIWDDALYEN